MMFKTKITRDAITIGPKEPTEIEALVWAKTLMDDGYRKVSNAYCMVARIDREDWLDVLAKQRGCSRADFYNLDGSGIGDQHKDHYVRMFSKDTQTVAPEILRLIKPYR